ncbi:hypothetical protein QN277_000651 [Acacia crassicarpa]|uniref:Glucose-1-phosphate adenylyltransferase/Bifunctional protein GlmU-like C-terminal hexapeptide domain-containing protein n=1 Tax=Acacia crassicarpa TaxID=499986 RepID=A0AAE1THD0_9FABA|nr:hypothetical protein QN277_000651 [Acacia crassicarpa]
MRPGGDGFGPCSDKFHKWHNGGGTLHESASIDSSAVVEIGAVVHSKAVVGANVHIGSGTIIGPSVIIGHSTKIGYNVALSNCQVGELCVVHNGVCIGQDGKAVDLILLAFHTFIYFNKEKNSYHLLTT